MASSTTPKLVVPEEKPANVTGTPAATSVPVPTIVSPTSATATKKLTKILSTQSSFDRHNSPHPIAKRFSIDADPSAIILNTPATDLSNHPSQQPAAGDVDETLSTTTTSKESLAAAGRSATLKKSDSFLEIPYEKGEIVDLIRLADDPDAAAHMTNDGHEVLLEHGAVSQ